MPSTLLRAGIKVSRKTDENVCPWGAYLWLAPSKSLHVVLELGTTLRHHTPSLGVGKQCPMKGNMATCSTKMSSEDSYKRYVGGM